MFFKIVPFASYDISQKNSNATYSRVRGSIK